MRLKTYLPANGNYSAVLSNSFVDDDAVATYYISSNNQGVIGPRATIPAGNEPQVDRSPLSDLNDQAGLGAAAALKEVFSGPIGYKLMIHPIPSLHVQQSDSLFDELGSSGTNLDIVVSAVAGDEKYATYKYIDTVINVTGVTTGYSLDIPIRIVKKKT